jgi:preprotein translocase subunit SecE
MRRFIQFLTEARAELKKVAWPTRKELISATTIVIVVSILSGVVLGVFDIAFSRSILWLISLLG